MILFMKRFDVWNRKNIYAFDVGCGKRPTLGIMLAYLRTWEIISLDPKVESREEHRRVNRFCVYSYKLGEVSPFLKPCFMQYEEIVVCANHSHHQFSEVENITQYAGVHYFVNPCCIDNLPKNIKGECYINTKIWSDKNRLYYFYLPKKNFEKAREENVSS
jgi:hypothetical protein